MSGPDDSVIGLFWRSANGEISLVVDLVGDENVLVAVARPLETVQSYRVYVKPRERIPRAWRTWPRRTPHLILLFFRTIDPETVTEREESP